MPQSVPVLRGRRPSIAATLSAFSRYVPRSAVQHSILRAAVNDDGAGNWTEGGRLRAYYGRHSPLPEPFRAGKVATLARTASVAKDEYQPQREEYI